VLFCDRTDLLKMTAVKEQRICIKFCFELSKTAVETHKMLKEAFGDNAIGLTQTCEWFKHFRNGRMSVDDDERCGRLRQEPRLNMRQKCKRLSWETEGERFTMFVTLSNCHGTCQRILSDEPNMQSHVTPCAAVFNFNVNDSHPPPSLLSRPRPL
jgi:hypothetical protein